MVSYPRFTCFQVHSDESLVGVIRSAYLSQKENQFEHDEEFSAQNDISGLQLSPYDKSDSLQVRFNIDIGLRPNLTLWICSSMLFRHTILHRWSV